MGAEIPRMDYRQYRAACRLVHECCNYDNGNCILLDNGEPCVCVQSISYSLMCRWFTAAVLPLDGSWKPPFTQGRQETLYRVRRVFSPKSNRGKYCPDCAARVRRRKEAERQRKRYHLSTHLGYERSP